MRLHVSSVPPHLPGHIDRALRENCARLEPAKHRQDQSFHDVTRYQIRIFTITGMKTGRNLQAIIESPR